MVEPTSEVLLDFFEFAVPMIVAVLLSLIVRRHFSGLVRKYVVKEQAGKETVFRLLERIIIVILLTAAFFISMSTIYPEIGSYLSSTLLAAGFLAIVIGLAAQRTLGNIFSGLNIALSRPIRIGDAVVIKDEYGNVEDITLRHTIIRTWDNRRLIIPNSVLDEEVIVNYTLTDSKMLFGITVHVPYDTDIEIVNKIMVEEARKHPNVLPELEPIFQVLNFCEASIELRILFLARDQPTAFGTGVDLRKAIKKRFDQEGVRFAVSGRYFVGEREGSARQS
jgi:small conductance mechanosensitive channel